MTPIQAYHRPQNVEKVLDLLARPGLKTAVLAGGVAFNAHRPEDIDEIVDIQAVGLDYIKREGKGLLVGAMTRLQTLVDSDDAPELVRDAARREGPNTFRHQGTLGGVIVGADPENELLAALLVSEAEVRVQTLAGTRTLALAEFLADVPAALAGGLLIDVSLATSGKTAAARVARTPADAPIVAAAARKTADGRILLALCGVASTPILVNPDQIADLNPPGDFRGSSAYRQQMAHTLSQRVLSALNQA